MLSSRLGDAVYRDRLLFGAKENLYKAWYAIERDWLGFEEARIHFTPEDVSLRQVLRPALSQLCRQTLTGKYAVTHEQIVTGLAIASKSNKMRHEQHA